MGYTRIKSYRFTGCPSVPIIKLHWSRDGRLVAGSANDFFFKIANAGDELVARVMRRLGFDGIGGSAFTLHSRLFGKCAFVIDLFCPLKDVNRKPIVVVRGFREWALAPPVE